MRHSQQWIVIFVTIAMLIGCRSEKDDRTAAKPESQSPSVQERSDEFLAKARRMFQLGDFNSAADAAKKALLQDPGSDDAKLIASEVEAARGNHQTAADLAASIATESRLGRRAVDIRYQQLVKLGRTSEAADVLLEAVEVIPSVPEWRREAWRY